MTTSSIRHPALMLAISCLLLLLLVLPSTSRAGDYSVRLTSTSGAHWSHFGASPFILGVNSIASGRGTFTPGDYRSRRVQVVGAGARIVGGTMRIGVVTPHAQMRARIVVGTGSSSTVVHEEYGTGGVEKALPGGPNDWVQFDLSSTGHVTTGAADENKVTLQFVDLVLRDSIPPVVAPISLPSPGTWHGASACIPFSLRLTDQGGGLLRSQVRRASDGAVITALGTTQVESPKPGPGEQHLSDCIAPGEHGHGDTTFIATVWDVSNAAHELAFTVRADHAAPTITGGIADGARVQTPRPELAFAVADQGSGLAAVTATLDGVPVAVSMAGGVATIPVGALARGTHVVAVGASDATGNGSRIERRFTVADDTPPTLAITAPGARGDASTTLTVNASDEFSGVDPATWSLMVDGEAAAFTADASKLTAQLGPLATGSHRFDIVVHDIAGNRTAIQHAFYVVEPPRPAPAPKPGVDRAPAPQGTAGPGAGAAAAAASGRSGAFLIDAPRNAVAFGRTAVVSIHVTRGGRAVVGQRVTSRRDGHELASAVTDADGVARVRVIAARPGRYDAVADGMGYDPVPLAIRVAPRMVITTSTLRPRVGQRVRIVGRLYPALRGRIGSVEARVGGVWFPIRRTARTSITGRFVTTVVSAVPGPIHVRVKVKPAGAWSGAVSNVRLLRVQR